MNSSQFNFVLSSMVQGKTTETGKVLNKIFLLATFNGKRASRPNESNCLSYSQMLVAIKQVGRTNGPRPSFSLSAVHGHCCLLFIVYQRAKFDYGEHHFEGRGAVARNWQMDGPNRDTFKPLGRIWFLSEIDYELYLGWRTGKCVSAEWQSPMVLW